MPDFDKYPVVIYMASSDGYIAKCWFKDEEIKDYALTVLKENTEIKFNTITQEYFDNVAPEAIRTTFKIPLRLKGKGEIVGYFEEYEDKIVNVNGY